jgi:hypothetical protein
VQVFDLESKTSHRRRFRGHSVYTQGIPLPGAGGCREPRNGPSTGAYFVCASDNGGRRPQYR